MNIWETANRLYEAAKLNCQCTLDACYKLNEHKPGKCQRKSGHMTVKIIGDVCDTCADRYPKKDINLNPGLHREPAARDTANADKAAAVTAAVAANADKAAASASRRRPR